jgi:hypothetical protein
LRKRPPPAAGEIKSRHIEHEQVVVFACATSKDLAQRALEIVPALVGFHCRNGLGKLWDGIRLLTMKRRQDFSVPLSREKTEAPGFAHSQKTSPEYRSA